MALRPPVCHNIIRDAVGGAFSCLCYIRSYPLSKEDILTYIIILWRVGATKTIENSVFRSEVGGVTWRIVKAQLEARITK